MRAVVAVLEPPPRMPARRPETQPTPEELRMASRGRREARRPGGPCRKADGRRWEEATAARDRRLRRGRTHTLRMLCEMRQPTPSRAEELWMEEASIILEGLLQEAPGTLRWRCVREPLKWGPLNVCHLRRARVHQLVWNFRKVASCSAKAEAAPAPHSPSASCSHPRPRRAAAARAPVLLAGGPQAVRPDMQQAVSTGDGAGEPNASAVPGPPAVCRAGPSRWRRKQ